jgi:hypothetical protein
MVWGILEKRLTICNFASLEWISERPLNPKDPYLTCSFIFSFLIPPPPALHHGPPFRALSRAGRLSVSRSRLGFRPPPNNSCQGHRLPPCLEPPYPGASALRSACRVVDHKSVLLVSFCQDMMQVGRAKPNCLSSLLKLAARDRWAAVVPFFVLLVF